MEKLNPNIAALSLGITAAAADLVCLIFIAAFPLNAVIKASNALIHGIDVSGIATKNISLAQAISGIFGWFAIAAVSGYIFAFAYNWLAEKFK